ncbi:MAG: lmo0937 family membrane protein [Pseudomonadota bacterium]
MLWSIAIILLLLWVIGMVTAYTLGGYIHVLIAAAVALLLVRIVKGSWRRPAEAMKR